MLHRKHLYALIPLAAAALPTAASAQLFYTDMANIRDQTIGGTSFNAFLAREYKDLALYEADEMVDWDDAERYAGKGNMARNGDTPQPYDPENWDIADKAARSDLEAGHDALVATFNDGARNAEPQLAAIAQARYDCWVEQQEEGHQFDHIAACRTQFWDAVGDIETAMTPAEPATAMVTETVSQEVARDTVYFEFDESTLTDAAMAKIDAIANSIEDIDNAEVAVLGFTDTAGPSDYNQKLSEARAASVVQRLVAQGVTVRDYEDFDTRAFGENRLAVETADGVREPRNRRVEIIAVGDVEVQVEVDVRQPTSS